MKFSMKKSISLLLCMVMVLSTVLTSCDTLDDIFGGIMNDFADDIPGQGTNDSLSSSPSTPGNVSTKPASSTQIKKYNFKLPVSGTISVDHDPNWQVFSPTMNDYRVHLGVDIDTKDGETVRAIGDGKVTHVWEDPLMGWCIEITHDGGIKSIYKNLDESLSNKTKEGDTVKAGHPIGKVGESAMMELAQEPHLHFEMMVNNIMVHPSEYFDKDVWAQLLSKPVESTPEGTSEQTPESAPAATPEQTPEATPEQKPEATPEQTPAATPEQTPEETPSESVPEEPEAEVQYDGLTLTLIDGEYSVTRYANNSNEVNIPSSYKGIPVTSIGAGAFTDCGALTSITIPDSVTSIGDWAFSECTSLSNLTIPDSVTSIGVGAFCNCSSLTSITIPNGVTSIENSVFSQCSSLTSITIPDSVTSIAGAAFAGCTGLTSITIPDSVTSIGEGAFDNCSNLASITLPFVGATKDGTENTHFRYIFEAGMTSLKTVVITGGTSIGNSAFYDCSGLTSITLPDSITSIGASAFENCSSLESITLPDSITSIGGSAFAGCTGLTSITIPDSVTSIGSGAFNDCSNLTSITLPFVGTTKDATGLALFTDVFNEGMTSLKTVVITGGTRIGELAFSNCGGLTSITLPDGITSIGNNAFYGCTGLTGITIPDGVTSIGDYAFSNCNNLESITLPDTITSIGDWAFHECTALTNVNIPTGVTSIGEGAFCNCDSLTSITIPDGVISIGEKAFSRCSGLTSITVPDSVTSIGKQAFYGCNKLESITLPFVGATKDGTANTYFGYIFAASGAGYEDNVPYSLKTVVITGGTRIDTNAFCFCSYLESITLPDSITSIGDYAFGECSSINYTVYKGGYYIGSSSNPYLYLHSVYDNITSFEILSSTKIINSGIFSHNTGITSITIPDNITTVPQNAFAFCENLKSITIGAGVTDIADTAFSGCGNLESITVEDGNTRYHSAGNCLIETESKTLILGCKNSIIPDDGSVTIIGDKAFYSCLGLTSIVIPDSITSIGASAFENCENLVSITIPDSITSIGDDAFECCYQLSYTTYGGGEYLGNENNPYVYLASVDKDITSFEIPNSTKVIVKSAFCDCTHLTSIVIPDSLTSIGDSMFKNCYNLASIVIGNGVTDIGNSAFYNCYNLTDITIPGGVTSIGDNAFTYCDSLENVYYKGEASKWSDIIIGNGNEALTSANICYN